MKGQALQIASILAWSRLPMTAAAVSEWTDLPNRQTHVVLRRMLAKGLVLTRGERLQRTWRLSAKGRRALEG